jgi:hypothetical protein
MDAGEIKLRPDHQVIVDRFLKACQQDDRILAAFLGGSYARGTADEFSDLDLYLITTDEDFDNFLADRRAFIGTLGKPAFLESFGNPNILFYIFEDGVDGELGIGREGQFTMIHSGPYQVLLDKQNVLAGAVFYGQQAEPAEQIERLHRILSVFWHELSHFITALGRGHLWWAQGQLESLRGFCVSLARMRSNFLDQEAEDEPYFKVEYAIPVEQIAVLQGTFGPLAKDHLLQAGLVIARVIRSLALPLTQEYGIPYPEALERVMVERLEKLS